MLLAKGGNPNDIMEVGRILERQKNFQNELFIFNSTPLIREVIEDMDLRTTYYMQVDKIPKELEFSLKDIYKQRDELMIKFKRVVDLMVFCLYFFVNLWLN